MFFSPCVVICFCFQFGLERARSAKTSGGIAFGRSGSTVVKLILNLTTCRKALWSICNAPCFYSERRIFDSNLRWGLDRFSSVIPPERRVSN
jgi:hypothetical protein